MSTGLDILREWFSAYGFIRISAPSKYPFFTRSGLEARPNTSEKVDFNVQPIRNLYVMITLRIVKNSDGTEQGHSRLHVI